MLVNSVRTALALKLQALKVDRRAVTAVEYALIAGLIAALIITAVTTLGNKINTIFTNVGNTI
jgi:pilus assembly protein Flp/PilA